MLKKKTFEFSLLTEVKKSAKCCKPVSGDILSVSLNEAILSAATGVLAAANDTGGVGGTRPSF